MTVSILTGDARELLRTLPDESVNCVVTSPPYFGLRDYGVAGQIGLEADPAAFVDELVAVFRDVRRVLRSDGTVWLNLGDSYAGSWGAQSREHAGKHAANVSAISANQVRAAQRRQAGTGSLARTPGLKAKDLIGIPWRVALALQADGWWLRSDIIWHKPNAMPESADDRCTRAHEYMFLLSKSASYHYDAAAIAEGRTSDEDSKTFRGGCYIGGNIDNGAVGKRQVVGNRRVRGVPPRHAGFPSSDRSGLDDVGRGGRRNKRSVWTVATHPFPDAHFATFPPALIEPCILAGCPAGGTVLDPFGGAGTTGLVADRLGRNAVLIELNPKYVAMAEARVREARLGPVSAMESRGRRRAAPDDAPLFAEAAE